MSELKCKYAQMVAAKVPVSQRMFTSPELLYTEEQKIKDGYYHGQTSDKLGVKGALIEDAETGQMLVVDFELVKIVRGEHKSLALSIAEQFTTDELSGQFVNILESSYISKGDGDDVFVSSGYSGIDIQEIIKALRLEPDLAVFEKAASPKYCSLRNGWGR